MQTSSSRSGSTWSNTIRDLWNPGGDKLVIHADFLPAEIDDRYMPRVELVGDLAHSLWMLNQRVDAHGAFSFDLGGSAKRDARCGTTSSSTPTTILTD